MTDTTRFDGVGGIPPGPQPSDTPTAEMGRAEIGRAEIGRAEVGRAEVGRAEVGRAEGGRQRSPLARRQRVLTAVALVAAIASTAGLVASTRIRSPQQIAADTRAPEPSLLTAPVVRKVLSTTLVMRGAVARGRQFPFTPTSVARTSHGGGGDVLIVTALTTRVGATVQAGRVLLEVSERPVYALPGAFPAYRDMLPGQTGKDIAQLQAGLRSLGYRIRDRRGHFGAGTQSAVRRFYRDRGYPVPLADAGAVDPPVARAAAPTRPQPTPAVPARAGGNPSASPAPTPSVTPPPPVMVPMSEVAFLPTLPARVATLPARVGDQVGNPLIAFTSGGLTLTGKLDPAAEGLAQTGMTAQVVSELTGFDAQGTVDDIGRKITRGDETYLPLRIGRRGGWPAQLEGDDVRITITTASTDGEVLAVPEAAISAAADGRTTVTVVDAGGKQRQVEVTPGVSADGMVEVDAVTAALHAGDAVVTGLDNPVGVVPGPQAPGPQASG